MDDKNAYFLNKLESLRQVFLGLKLLHSCTVPSNRYKIENELFHHLNHETVKLILGRLIILLSDKKNAQHNTVSFIILIDEILKNEELECDKEKLKGLRTEIDEAVNSKNLKTYRDKLFAHIDLNPDNSLRNIGEFCVSNKHITDLLDLSQRSYDTLFLELHNASTDHMKNEIEQISIKLWKTYETAGLVTRKPVE